jgi:hypothetical protein
VVTIIKEETQELIAKYLCDMSKAILTIAFASQFFKDLPWFLRISCGILALAFLVVGVILMEMKGEQKWRL